MSPTDSNPVPVVAAVVPAPPALLQEHISYFSLVTELSAVIKAIPTYQSLKGDMSLVQHLLTIVRARYADWDEPRIAKVITDTLQKAFVLSPDEMVVLAGQIGFIVANGLSALPAKKPKTLVGRAKSFFSASKPSA